MKLTKGYYYFNSDKYKYWKLGDCICDIYIGDAPRDMKMEEQDMESFINKFGKIIFNVSKTYLDFKYKHFIFTSKDGFDDINKSELRERFLIHKFNQSFLNKIES